MFVVSFCFEKVIVQASIMIFLAPPFKAGAPLNRSESLLLVSIPAPLTLLGAVLHLIPILLPFFSPDKWAIAHGTELTGEVTLFNHAKSPKNCLLSALMAAFFSSLILSYVLYIIATRGF